MYLEEEVKEDSNPCVEGEGSDCRDGCDAAQKEGSCLRERGKEQTGSHLSDGPTNDLLTWHNRHVPTMMSDQLAGLTLGQKERNNGAHMVL